MLNNRLRSENNLNVFMLGRELPMKPIARLVFALALATNWIPFNSRGQQSETELLKQARVTKHQAKKIALARVKRGAIKCVELEKENGVLIWSIDIAQLPKKDLTDVWVDATTGKITAIEVETPITEAKEVVEQKARKWLSHHNAH
jgi:hypothetical protein